MSNPHPRGSRWNTFRRLVFQTYGDICIVCGHGGSRTVDHLESVTEHPELTWELSNCRPIHGVPYNRCPVCKQNCNGIKGGYSVERARRLWAAKTHERPPGQGKPPPTGPVGRDW